MADRERLQASAPALAGVLGALVLVALGPAGPSCSRQVVQADSSTVPVAEGLRSPSPATKTPPRIETAPAPASSARPDPGLERRARALTGSFRAAITRWTEEARKRSHGKAGERNVRVAVAVHELGSGAELVALRADEPQRPASNLKLVTTAAALVLLGRDVEFVTPVDARGSLENGVLAGDLVLRAAGDPLWDPEGRGHIEGRLDELARRLRARGLREVQGDLVLDEGSFAEPGPGPSWPDPSQRWAEYCALSGGFSANGGVLCAEVQPRALGERARVEVHPSPHGLRSAYDVRTVAGTVVDVRVGATVSTVTVQGALGERKERYLAEFAHPDPVELFGTLLRSRLEANGIEIAGGLRRERGIAPGQRLAELRSPLSELLEPINAESKNGVADQLFLALGHTVAGEGTRAGGARAVRQALERLGLERDHLVQVDGSGLSRDNRISARAIAVLLERVLGSDPETARLYKGSLAVAGRKGTLEDRLRGTAAEGRVFAKTGWIAGTSALSGLCELPDGRSCVFSILVEYPSELSGLNSSCFKPLQDELALCLFEEAP